jgi:hypothetical protein
VDIVVGQKDGPCLLANDAMNGGERAPVVVRFRERATRFISQPRDTKYLFITLYIYANSIFIPSANGQVSTANPTDGSTERRDVVRPQTRLQHITHTSPTGGYFTRVKNLDAVQNPLI